MLPQNSETTTTPAPETPEFSLVQGGPLFQMFRRAHLSGDALELLGLRVLVISLFAWLPLLVLSLIQGHALGGVIKIPFLYDVEAHTRFLIALPALILAELIVHHRVSPVARQFVERRILSPKDLPSFNAAIHSALRARNSVALELTLLILVYTFGLWIWRSQIAFGAPTWYATPDTTGLHLTPAGYWYGFVSIPIFQFILIRWYMRLVIWFRFLWQVSRLSLNLTASHPDRSGGIGFLGHTSYAFGPILFAEGTLLSGVIASRVLYAGHSVLEFKMEVVGVVVALVLFILGPLVMFTPQMEHAKRKGLREFGLLASRYVFGFEKKWIQGGAPDMAELLGTGDIQSLADLGNSYAVVEDMRIVPFELTDVIRIVVATAAPLLPLVLTVIPPQELLTKLLQALL
jgi:hypothetical protein